MTDRAPVRAAAAALLAAACLSLALLAPESRAAPDSPAGAPVREGPRVEDPRPLGIGHQVADFAFTDVDGNASRLSAHRGKTVVVLSRGVTCPISKKYGPSAAKLAKEWAADGVEVLVLGVAEQDSLDDLRGDRDRTGIPATWVHDADGSVRNTLGVRTTTEAFVIDGARTLVYRGAVDDRYGLGYARDAARESYVADALRAVEARRRPVVEATSAPG